MIPESSFKAFLCQGQFEDRFVPVLGRPVVRRVFAAYVSSGDGFQDRLVVRLVGHDEDVYESREGEQRGEEEHYCEGEEDFGGALRIVRVWFLGRS